MPSAAQEESMRKLCEMMGYDMKYYQAATTKVTVYFNGDETDFRADAAEANSLSELILPRFTEFTTIDGDITYTSLEQVSFNSTNTSAQVDCIEGVLHYCAEEIIELLLRIILTTTIVTTYLSLK